MRGLLEGGYQKCFWIGTFAWRNCWHWLARDVTIFPEKIKSSKAKKKGIRFSGHFLQKQMRQAGFPPPPQKKKQKTNEATVFFIFTPSNLILNLNANRSGKYVSYAFFLGWGSLGMQLELAWTLCLELEQGSCSNVQVTPKCWDTILTQMRYAVKIINLIL